MLRRSKLVLARSFAVLVLILSFASAASAQSTAFTYQGRLTDAGNPANGPFDLQFKLFDTLSVGAQQGSTVAIAMVPASNGIFTVNLDFGSNVFGGADRYLEIGVRPGGSGIAYAVLTPRQPVHASPYAIQSLSATNADNLGGLPPGRYVSSNAIGYVGIGIGAPVQRLEVGGNIKVSGAGNAYIFADGTVQSTAAAGGGGGVGGGGSAQRIPMFLNSSTLTDSAMAQANGNIGIGTTNPTSKLEIAAQDGLAITGYQPYLTLRDTNAGNKRSIIAGGNGDFGFYPDSFIGFTPAILVKNISGNVSISAVEDPGSRVKIEAGNNPIGLYSNTTMNYAVFGAATTGTGVYGYSSSNGYGVKGVSASGSGVYGEASASNPQIGGVYGRGMGAGSIGVVGESNVANYPVGVFGVSSAGNGVGVYARNYNGTALYVEGDARQSPAGGGIAKALVNVNALNQITQCYNSALTGSAATTVPCGITSTRRYLGGIQYLTDVHFGYDISQRFFVATPGPCSSPCSNTAHNMGINVYLYDATTLSVAMFVTTEPIATDITVAFSLAVF